MGTFAPPSGFAGPTYTTAQVKAQIDVVAAGYGLPPQLAEAIAQHESGFNPYAVGDHGTSFGIYQLHEGGELDSLPGSLGQRIGAAYDPTANAKVALRQVASVYARNPDADPGAIAAAAQRPANPSAYAGAIDSILGGARGGPVTNSGGGSSSSSGGTVATTAADGSPFGSGTTTYKLTPVGPSLTIWSWPRIGFAVLGGLLVLLGIYVTFKDAGGSSNILNLGGRDTSGGDTSGGDTSGGGGAAPQPRRRPGRTKAGGTGAVSDEDIAAAAIVE